jgi:hypothetical protein
LLVAVGHVIVLHVSVGHVFFIDIGNGVAFNLLSVHTGLGLHVIQHPCAFRLLLVNHTVTRETSITTAGISKIARLIVSPSSRQAKWKKLRNTILTIE